ncbi:MAG: hypothetical protein MPK31_04300 [Gammaproteobacteria bacterium]|nr:hypothetical protein [Gammaproteobacteria bacterium]MDA8014436.1 hypothetical protein [Gammaproteobacteria bacterium]
MAEIKRSTGVNPSEKILAKWCDHAFLRAWTYHNPHRAKGTELCDSLVVFNGHILIFQIKEIKFSAGADVHTAWERWKRRAITKQLKSLEGAKNWILRYPDRIYRDTACEQRLKIHGDIGDYKIHKILVAHGAAEACKNYFGGNFPGNLPIFYGDPEIFSSPPPFTLVQDKQDPIHVLDGRSLAIILGELDTAFEFTEYLLAKERAIQKLPSMSYRGEENLLARYFSNFDELSQKHYIVSATEEDVGIIFPGENDWNTFLTLPEYKRKKDADKISYLWDSLMQRVYELSLKGSAKGNSGISSLNNPILEMAKEPRFWRRGLSETLANVFQEQENSADGQPFLSLRGSYYKGTAYVFWWVDRPSGMSQEKFIQVRKDRLRIACGVAKNSQPQFTKIVGIAFGLSRKGVVALGDFYLMDCREWTDENKSRYEEANKVTKFFKAMPSKLPAKTVREFPREEGMPHLETAVNSLVSKLRLFLSSVARFLRGRR